LKPLCVLCAAWVCSLPAAASTAFYIIEKDHRFQQDGPSTINSNGFDIIATVFPNPTSPFDGATLDIPGQGSVALTNFGGGLLQFSSVGASDFPTGTYTFHATDSTNSANNENVSVDDSVESFPSAIPALTPGSFNALAAFDPTQDFLFSFNTFVGGAAPFDGGLIFFEILDLGDLSRPFIQGVQPNVGQVTLPGGTLQTGRNYEWVLFFQNALVTANTQLETDTRTRGFFSTAATTTPEPDSLLLAAAGIAGLWGMRRLRR